MVVSPGPLDDPLRPVRPMPARNVASIVIRTMNLMDARLMNHGQRVAELADKVLEVKGYTQQQRRDVALMALLHDAGAYKTEEIDRIVHFETVNVWQHSIYGYLYLKHLTPLARLAPAVFFHHASLAELRHLHPSFHELAQILHIADRLDIMGQVRGGLDRRGFLHHFERGKGVQYRADLVDCFDGILFGGLDKTPLSQLFESAGFSHGEQRAYLHSLPLSIDFRSPQTVTHTMGVACIADELSALSDLSETQAGRVRLGALLHDLGKQGIPPRILESPSRLDGAEMAVMRTHVRLTEDVLDGNVEADVMRIAVRHHERPNGGGYHRGLGGEELSHSERLVAVADVMSALMGVRSYKDSFPRDKVQSIVESMARQGDLDRDLAHLALGQYERIAAAMLEVCAATVDMYKTINREYDELLALSRRFPQSDWMLGGELVW